MSSSPPVSWSCEIESVRGMRVHPDEDGGEQGEDVGLDEGHQELQEQDEEREPPARPGSWRPRASLCIWRHEQDQHEQAGDTMWPASMFANRRIMRANGRENMPRISTGIMMGRSQDRQAGGHHPLEVVDDAVLGDARLLLGRERHQWRGARVTARLPVEVAANGIRPRSAATRMKKKNYTRGARTCGRRRGRCSSPRARPGRRWPALSTAAPRPVGTPPLRSCGPSRAKTITRSAAPNEEDVDASTAIFPIGVSVTWWKPDRERHVDDVVRAHGLRAAVGLAPGAWAAVAAPSAAGAVCSRPAARRPAARRQESPPRRGRGRRGGAGAACSSSASSERAHRVAPAGPLVRAGAAS